MNELDEIVIEGLRIDTVIGVYAHEREQAQPLFFDIAMACDFRASAQGDELSATIDYAAVVAFLREFILSRRDLLLERLVDEVCQHLAVNFKPKRIRLQVRKPQAAQALGCAAVGIRVERHY